jgi:hypothetical protein
MVDYSKLNDMCDWEREKAMYLIKIAQELGMKTEGYGELAVNENSGYTYLWLEDYPFTLYLPISCELTKNDVYALWTNSDDGEEIEIELGDKTLDELYSWVDELEMKMRNDE